ncbi:MAG: hypothetical protein IPG45_28515 [Deltaproteobacteria bacterium]|jgi:hypothetical protein|nr:hypothetical protein [Deltaproteobacteria bacterium]
MLVRELGSLIDERGWPVQRLRMGWSLVLFFFFETLLGKQLPIVMAYLALGAGLTLLGWASLAIRDWKMQTQLALIQEALDRRPR